MNVNRGYTGPWIMDTPGSQHQEPIPNAGDNQNESEESFDQPEPGNNEKEGKKLDKKIHKHARSIAKLQALAKTLKSPQAGALEEEKPV